MTLKIWAFLKAYAIIWPKESVVAVAVLLTALGLISSHTDGYWSRVCAYIVGAGTVGLYFHGRWAIDLANRRRDAEEHHE